MDRSESKNRNDCHCLESGSHIAVFDRGLLDKVLDGKKRFDSRFSKEKCVPYDSINNGDTIYLKEKGGPVVAKAKADNIKFYANLNDEKIRIFKYTYSSILLMDNDFWNREKDSQYATLFALKDVQGIPPISIHDSDHLSWIILNEDNNNCECFEVP